MTSTALPPGRWESLKAHASARRYWRGEWEGRPALLAHYGDDSDGRARFVSLSRWLLQAGIRVPAVLAAPSGEPWVVQEFVAGEDASRSRWDRALEARVFNLAGLFASLDRESWPSPLILHALDEARLRFELAFFELHFLEGLLNRPHDSELRAALDDLAQEVAGYPPVFAHRDFHSDNLRVTPAREVVVVDFQDLLLAPRCYDMASLAMDSYRTASQAFRGRCASWCADHAGAAEEEFSRTALQRSLKALGTFGFQVTRRKLPGYLSAARATVPRVLEHLHTGPPGLAVLRGVLERAREML